MAMESQYGRANRIWVMDRGMVSENNLRFVRQRGGSYIVGTPRSMLHQFERHLTDKNWHEVQEGVEVKLVAGPEGNEAFILARSTDRRQKENAMHQRFINRMELDLQKMQRSAASGRLKDIQLAHRRLGRIQQRYWRASGAFDVKVVPIEKPTDKARLKVTFKRNKQWSDWAQLSEGCYLLRTNLTDMDPKTLWRRYIQLTEAEWAFRIAKDELVIRPIWHQKADRVKAHILVCFLAYVLWKSLAQWMRRAGLGDAPRTLIEEFAKIKSGDVVLPAKTSDGRKAKTVRLRCVTAPDQAQKVLLHRLGLNLPQRLRRIDEGAQM
jgi:transposase